MPSTTLRVLRQLRHDPRTVVLVLLLPVGLMALLHEVFPGGLLFQRAALPLLGIFPFIVMFLVTSIAVLRERTSGTLERLFTTPLRRLDLVFGYGIAFGLAATAQAVLVTTVARGLLGLDVHGHGAFVVLVAGLTALLGVATGLLSSAFARSEFQAVQFMPVVALPQILLCGLFVPRGAMAPWLEKVSDVLPLSYSVDALLRLTRSGTVSATAWRDLAVVAAFTVAALVAGSLTLHRRSG